MSRNIKPLIDSHLQTPPKIAYGRPKGKKFETERKTRRIWNQLI
ncbi:hypothetical protein HMPREF6485_0274 [Segatella buccae ATCC 33574]|uniref:Uncharacterized protein n=1 Tax=Segatella buccae ATCC 33574 TaxID=873513 RepID=E6K3E9_9BACT|nr:hypothetical protein HMPREF6485_0274 [Segatella buccae ATCC 33574]